MVGVCKGNHQMLSLLNFNTGLMWVSGKLTAFIIIAVNLMLNRRY